MSNPIDLELAPIRARAEQTRSFLRDSLQGMDRDELLRIIAACARGDLEVLDDGAAGVVARLALLSVIDLVEDTTRKGG
jgi:hypothetical protein